MCLPHLSFHVADMSVGPSISNHLGTAVCTSSLLWNVSGWNECLSVLYIDGGNVYFEGNIQYQGNVHYEVNVYYLLNVRYQGNLSPQ
jgi:hypothetical protein